MSVRIGVYVCHCGWNIAGNVDVEAVARFAAACPGAAIETDHFTDEQIISEIAGVLSC